MVRLRISESLFGCNEIRSNIDIQFDGVYYNREYYKVLLLVNSCVLATLRE